MRLIDADELKDKLRKAHLCCNREWLQIDLDEIIDNAPTVEPTISLKNISDEEIQNFKMIWQRTAGKGLLAQPERPQGEWVYDSDNLPVCKECGEIALQRVFAKMPHLIQEVRMVKSNFCPNCGADMRGDNNE